MLFHTLRRNTTKSLRSVLLSFHSERRPHQHLFADPCRMQGPLFHPGFLNPRACISGFVGFSESPSCPPVPFTSGSSPWAFWHLSSLPQADSFVHCAKEGVHLLHKSAYCPQAHPLKILSTCREGAAPLHICPQTSLPSALLGPGLTLNLPLHCLSFCSAVRKAFYGAAVIVSVLVCLQR